mgnify:CR=1 FL=1
MSHTPHELADDFPEDVERIHALKLTNAHFAKLVDEYHEANREVHRMETRVEPVDETTEHAARRRRVQLKDEIAAMLKSA